MPAETFRCYLVRKLGKEQIEAGVEERPFTDLPAGDVLVRVAWSSLNYKDALAATGHPGVARRFPHVPGIDAAGTVAESQAGPFQPGDAVLVGGYGLGSDHWGGWAEYIRVPAEWVVPLPEGLSLKEAAIYGTAGFTAALSLQALHDHHVTPDGGEIVVTGATGGVGVMAVKLLSKLGYRVVAVSGKQEKHAWLRELGAAEILGRDEVNDQSGRPLLSARWAGAIDTVGGNTLGTLLRSTQNEGCVTACGLVGGADLPVTVYPFILRGVTLAGISSAWTPRPQRDDIWAKLAGPWKLDDLEALSTEVDLAGLDEAVQTILAGGTVGRVIVRTAE